MKILRFPLSVALPLLSCLSSMGATASISSLPLKTSPSTNTFMEIADMNAGTKSGKYLLTNLATVAALSTKGNAVVFVAASDASMSDKAIADYTCTGTADQTTINTAAALGRGVRLAAGNYSLSDSIIPLSNITIEGAGAGTRLTGTTTNVTLLTIANVTNVTLRSVNLIGAGRNYTGTVLTNGNGITVTSSTNVTIVDVTGHRLHNFVYGLYSTNVVVNHCAADSCSSSFVRYQGCLDSLVESSFFDGLRTGIGDAASCLVGIWFQGGPNADEYDINCSAFNTTVKNASNEAFMSHGLKSKFIGNTAVGCTKGFQLEPSANSQNKLEGSFGVISGNHAELCSYSGITVAGENGLNLDVAYRAVVTDNVITNCGDGIEIFGLLTSQTALKPANCTVANNLIDGCSQYGMYLNTVGSLISGNIVRNTTNVAVQMDYCDRVNFTGNLIESGVQAGISLNPSRQNINITIADNVITNINRAASTYDSIYISGSATNIHVLRNRTDGTGRYGLSINTGCIGTWAFDNELHGTTGPILDNGTLSLIEAPINGFDTVGADGTAGADRFNATDLSNKYYYLYGRNKTNANAAISLWNYSSGSGGPTLNIGGGVGSRYAANQLSLWGGNGYVLNGYEQVRIGGSSVTIYTNLLVGTTNVVGELASKSPIASPTFTGTATAPTAAIATATIGTLTVTNAITAQSAITVSGASPSQFNTGATADHLIATNYIKALNATASRQAAIAADGTVTNVASATAIYLGDGTTAATKGTLTNLWGLSGSASKVMLASGGETDLPTSGSPANSSTNVVVFEEFLANSTSSNPSGFATTLGTGASCAADNTTAGHMGLWKMQSGTSEGGAVAVTQSALSVLFGSGAVSFEAYLLAAVPSAANKLVARVGFLDVYTTNSPVDGVWFDYDTRTNTVWRCASCSNSGAWDLFSTATTVSSANYVKLKIDVASDASSAIFSIDGTPVYTNSTAATIPSGASRNTGAAVVHARSEALSNYSMFLDYVRLSYALMSR